MDRTSPRYMYHILLLFVFTQFCFSQQPKPKSAIVMTQATNLTGRITVGGSYGWSMKEHYGMEGYLQGVWWLLTTSEAQYYLDIKPWDYSKVTATDSGTSISVDGSDRPFNSNTIYTVLGSIVTGKIFEYDNIKYKTIRVKQIKQSSISIDAFKTKCTIKPIEDVNP
jgi:hypothetical protein